MNNLTYANFDLLLERACAGYSVRYRGRVIDSPAGQGSADFDPPFTPAELAGFPLVNPTPEVARDRGGRLYTAVFAGIVGDLLGRSRHEAESAGHPAGGSAGRGLRIRLRLAAAPELAAWPWETLYDPDRRQFLALSASTPVVRYLDLPGRVGPLAVRPPLRMLVVIAEPRGYPAIDGAREWETLRAALQPLAARGALALERLTPATLRALQARLRQAPWHILHFVGHGGFDETAGGFLVFENEAGRDHGVPAAHLAALLHDERDSLRLVVLNACGSGRGSGRGGGRGPAGAAFSGTAHSLVAGGVPAVVAALGDLDDQAAITLAREFYAALADGCPVDAALAEARKAIYTGTGNMTWGNLTLTLRAADGRIFDFGAGDAGRSGAEEATMSKRDRPDRIDTGGGAFIGGGVHTGGGKFIGRDEVVKVGDRGVYVGGDIRGSTVVTSNHVVIGAAVQGASLVDLTRLLAEIRALLPAAGLGRDIADVVDADVRVVEAQVARTQPSKAIVVGRLKGIAELLAAAGGGAAAAEKLAPRVEKAVALANQLLR